MKSNLHVFATLIISFACGNALSDEVLPPSDAIEARITAPILEKSITDQPLAFEKPHFEIESTQNKQIDVQVSPPMPGLPPIEGTMTLTIHGVADPHLEDIQAAETPSAPPLTSTAGEEYHAVPESLSIGISATVYNHSRSLLQIQSMDDAGNSLTVWSNIDFNHFIGVSSFEARRADGSLRSYGLVTGVANETTAHLATKPVIPQLSDDNLAFLILTPNPSPEAVRVVEDLHVLYRTEGAKMAADLIAREEAEQAKRESLLANPPEPQDVTVHFWRREEITETQTTEGGQE